MSYPVDMQSVKNTKLFKKFMQSRNKSSSFKQNIDSVNINLPIQDLDVKPVIQILSKQSQDKQSLRAREGGSSSRGSSYLTVGGDLQVGGDREKWENQGRKQPAQSYSNTKSISREKMDVDRKDNEKREAEKKDNEKRQFERRENNQKQNDKRYEKLTEEYTELQEKVSQQRKQHRKQTIKLEQQIQILNKKLFELRSRQDELILENKRLKQKSVYESKERRNLQESNREFALQVQELKDMLDGQSNSSKQKEDETSHWRKLNDDLRQKVRELESQVAKQKDLNSMKEREKHVMEREVGNKEHHLNQLREKIDAMITENGVLRDEIFRITSKLYQFQQENKSLKADLKRHSDSFPMSYLQEKLQEASMYTKQEQTSHPAETPVEHPERRRRGEFAKERFMRKPEPQHEQKTQTPHKKILANNRETVRRLEQLNDELQKLKQSKAMNGMMRRQKINLQREIQELEQQLKTQ